MWTCAALAIPSPVAHNTLLPPLCLWSLTTCGVVVTPHAHLCCRPPARPPAHTSCATRTPPHASPQDEWDSAAAERVGYVERSRAFYEAMYGERAAECEYTMERVTVEQVLDVREEPYAG